jgi:hypothetical protein
MKMLRAFAVLFGLLAFSNFLKPFGLSEDAGFVFLGRRLSGTPNLIAGWSFAVLLACYASSLWREKAAALPIGMAYAAYVSANLFLFSIRPQAAGGASHPVFDIVYTIIALGGAWGAVAAMRSVGLDQRDAVPGRILLRSFALLFALMALSDALKPFAYTPETGFVLLGQRLSGTPNTVVALTFSALLATYAASIWQENRRALTLGIAYAVYVAANLTLWNFRKPEGAETPLIFGLPYLISAIGVSSGAAWLLWRHRDRLA